MSGKSLRLGPGELAPCLFDTTPPELTLLLRSPHCNLGSFLPPLSAQFFCLSSTHRGPSPNFRYQPRVCSACHFIYLFVAHLTRESAVMGWTDRRYFFFCARPVFGTTFLFNAMTQTNSFSMGLIIPSVSVFFSRYAGSEFFLSPSIAFPFFFSPSSTKSFSSFCLLYVGSSLYGTTFSPPHLSRFTGLMTLNLV